MFVYLQTMTFFKRAFLLSLLYLGMSSPATECRPGRLNSGSWPAGFQAKWGTSYCSCNCRSAPLLNVPCLQMPADLCRT